MEYRQPVWWGTQDVDTGHTVAWDMAGLLLEFTRQPQEWQVRQERTRAQSEVNHEWRRRDGAALAASPSARLDRHVFRQAGPRLTLLPRLADRPVVVRPVSPLFVPAGQETTFFVSTPLWLAAFADGAAQPLLDIPVVIPRDTWFGPSPVRGQLGYATRVTGVTDLALLQPRPFRAVTPVHVRNGGTTALPIERISIPAPFLPLYGAESGRLWTPAVAITRHGSGTGLQVQIESGITTRAGHVEPLSPARRGGDEFALVRVFDNFFD